MFIICFSDADLVICSSPVLPIFPCRVLIHLGMHPDTQATVAVLANEHGISRHHLTRVVHQLGLKGYIETLRGKGGGFRLVRRPDQIRIGDVVRDMETGFELAECFRPGESACRLLPACALKPVLAEAGPRFPGESGSLHAG